MAKKQRCYTDFFLSVILVGVLCFQSTKTLAQQMNTDQGKGDSVVLNSEYLLSIGTIKPQISVADSIDKIGLDSGTVAFNIQWSAGGSPTAVQGGWESSLWWLRNMLNAKVKLKVKAFVGEPVISFRFNQSRTKENINATLMR
ncbi:MAG: hypothetical protein QM640_07575 [Niabella sp.]